MEIEHAIAVVIAPSPDGFDVELVHLHHHELLSLEAVEQVEVEVERLDVFVIPPCDVQEVHRAEFRHQ